MKLIWAIVCIMAMWTAIKFVFLVFKRLGSKNSMNSMIDKMEEKMSEGADNVAYYIKENRRKKKEKKDEEDRPIVTIR